METIREMKTLPNDLIFFTIDEQTSKRGGLNLSPTFIKENKEMFGRLLIGNQEIIEKIKRK